MAPIWSMYLIRSVDDRLYTGVSTDVERRFSEHENTDRKNKGAKALRGKTPLKLVYQIVVGNRSDALKLEYRVKQLSRIQKEYLIGHCAQLEDLRKWMQNL